MTADLSLVFHQTGCWLLPDGSELAVERLGSEAIRLTVNDVRDHDDHQVIFDADQAVSLAMALLDAAGPDVTHLVGVLRGGLRRVVEMDEGVAE